MLTIWDAAPVSYQVRPESLEGRFNPHPARWKTKTMSSEIKFPTLTSGTFSTKNSINKPAMNNRRLLIAAVFHFMHPVEKDSKKTLEVDKKNSVSFSCQSKQVSRCCINFLHELTCQISTNHSIKIGRRAWPTRVAEFLRLRSVWNQNVNSARP